jgi:hypothetical protein
MSEELRGAPSAEQLEVFDTFRELLPVEVDRVLRTGARQNFRVGSHLYRVYIVPGSGRKGVKNPDLRRDVLRVDVMAIDRLPGRP